MRKGCSHIPFKFWWAETESNRRHKDFQSFALPTELSAHQKRGVKINIFDLKPKTKFKFLNFC